MRGRAHSQLGTQDAEGRFTLRPATPEEIEEANHAAAKARTRQPSYVEMRPDEVEAHEAAYFEPVIRNRHARAALDFGVDSAEELAARRELALCLRTQGRLEECLALCPDDAKFLKGAEAVERPDDEWCSCEPDYFVDPMYSIRCQKPLYSAKPVKSPRHAGQAHVHRCLKCGHLNISDQWPPQDRVIRARMAAMKGKRNVHQSQILKA